MQLSFKSEPASAPHARRRATLEKALVDLEFGCRGVLARLEVPDDVAQRLMELGFVPGHVIVPGRSAPGGDPRVFQVDGSEVALRRETAARLWLRPENEP